jgi:hypothetical protein
MGHREVARGGECAGFGPAPTLSGQPLITRRRLQASSLALVRVETVLRRGGNCSTMFGELGAHHPDLGLLSARADSTNYLGARIVIAISTMREDDQLGVSMTDGLQRRPPAAVRLGHVDLRA